MLKHNLPLLPNRAAGDARSLRIQLAAEQAISAVDSKNVTSLNEQIKQIQDATAPVEAQIAGLNSMLATLKASRTETDDDLREIMGSLGTTLYLTQVSQTTDKIDLAGGGPTTDAIYQYARALSSVKDPKGGNRFGSVVVESIQESATGDTISYTFKFTLR